MKKIALMTDLDGTLIYSNKKAYNDDICIEVYNNEQHGFMPRSVYDSINDLISDIDILPVTTRNIAQYDRLQLPDSIKTAFVDNGMTIRDRINGTITPLDTNILSETRKKTNHYTGLCETIKAYHGVIKAEITDELYIYVLCDHSSAKTMYAILKNILKDMIVKLSGRKIYIMEPYITKANAVRYQRKRSDIIIAAGDSVLDIPMLKHADYAIIPSTDVADRLLREIENDKWNGYIPHVKNVYAPDGTYKKTFPEFIIERTRDILQKEGI